MVQTTQSSKNRSKSNIPQALWSEARPERIVLISGPESLFADRAWSSIREQLRLSDSSLEIHDVEASQYEHGTLFTLASPSLFGEPRLIRVSGVEKSSDAFIIDAKRYLEAPDETTTLVLRHAGGQRGKAVLDAIRSESDNRVEILCPEVKPADRINVARSELRRLGSQIEPGALNMLVEAFQGSLEELISACTQLVDDTDGKRINEGDVERITGGRVEANAFRVADAAIAGRTAAALVLLRQSLSTGTAPIPLLAAINMKVRAMARVYGTSGSSGQLARSLGMAPWQVDRAKKDLRGWREIDLAHTINQGAESELLLKGGTRDPQFALERYVLLISRKGHRLDTEQEY